LAEQSKNSVNAAQASTYFTGLSVNIQMVNVVNIYNYLLIEAKISPIPTILVTCNF